LFLYRRFIDYLNNTVLFSTFSSPELKAQVIVSHDLAAGVSSFNFSHFDLLLENH